MADEQLAGFSATWSALPAEQLTDHLHHVLQSGNTLGLVEGLEAALWLRGRADGRAQIYRLGENNSTVKVFEFAAADLIATWRVGRIFNPLAEWRWQQQADGRYQLLGLAEERQQLTLWSAVASSELGVPRDGWRVSAHKQQLVGSTIVCDLATTGASAWAETRNPRPLLYPLEHRNRLEVQPFARVHRYTTANHVVRFTRFCELSCG